MKPATLETTNRRKMTPHSNDTRPDATVPGAGTYKAAPFVARFFAFAIDAAILGCCSALLVGLTALLLLRILPLDFVVIARTLGFSLFVLLFIPIVLPMAYFAIFHAVSGRTIGKIIMGIQVVAAANGLLTPGAAFLRWVGYLVSAIPAAAGFFWSVLDREHDAWHDKLAGSHVISL